jgi:hypothetical protein
LPALSRGGGFEAMQILHQYDIDGTKKGALQDKTLSDEIKVAKGMYKLALELIQKYE